MRKRIIAYVTIGVDSGQRTEDGTRVTLMMPPGAEVELDADEADRIIERWGGEVLEVLPDDPSPASKFLRQ